VKWAAIASGFDRKIKKRRTKRGPGDQSVSEEKGTKRLGLRETQKKKPTRGGDIFSSTKA